MMRNVIIVLALIIVVIIAARICLQKVPLGYVGVRQNLIRNVIERRDLQPGFHFVIPFVHRLNQIDSTIQVTNFGSAGIVGDHMRPRFELRAQDEYMVGLDVSLLWRVKPGNAAEFRQTFSTMLAAERNLAAIAAEEMQAVLGELRTEDFYDADTRAGQARRTLERLRARAVQSYVRVESLLLRDIMYDERFEEQIRQRQVLEQERLLQRSLTIKEREQEVTETVRKETQAAEVRIKAETDRDIRRLIAETDAAVAVIDASAELYAQKSIAEASREYRELLAQGELLRTRAKARGEQAVAAAYQGVGGDLYLLRQMIDNVKLGRVEINTNQTNPFDVHQMLEMLGSRLTLDREGRPSPPPLAPEQYLERGVAP